MKTITQKQSERIWGVKFQKAVKNLYSKKVLGECEKENKKGQDWRLVFIQGLSLLELRDKVGFGKDGFYNNEWWLKESFARQKPERGWYLINFNGQFPKMSWNEQEIKIKELGFERADEAVVTEAAFSFYKTNKENLLKDWCHWGRSLDSDGRRVRVGFFDSGGWFVSGDRPGWGGSGGLRVCLLRKFDSGNIETFEVLNLENRVKELEDFKKRVEEILIIK